VLEWGLIRVRPRSSAAIPLEKEKTMKVVFIGGGSFRILPIIRGALAQGRVFQDGEIRLVDLNIDRAGMVGRMIMRTPEFQGSGCKVLWGKDLDKALDGADALYVTMAVGSTMANLLSAQASHKRGFISSDQLSLTGAFLALTAGPAILGFARRMEKRCPDARMLIFANPVAVYSGMVNNHTRIPALGICGGYLNHRWDLPRLMGREEYCDEFELDVAGVNHLSFILGGTYRGEDIYEVLGRCLTKGWRPPKVRKEFQWLAHHIHYGLRKLVYLYHRFGKIIFSTEGDGMTHLFYEEMFERGRKESRPLTKAQIRAQARAAEKARKDADSRFREHLTMELDDRFWAQPAETNRWFGRNEQDVTIPILKALSGMGKERIVASRPSNGAVAGFKDRTVVEYSQVVDRRGWRPAGNYEVPDCFHGLISALATHQTLLGDAIATRDPRVLADALFAYPVKQNTRDSRALCKELLGIHKDEIPASFQAARDFI
jgi:alpha-galactosidase/6-phospho-beta-glucosidase family protein